MMAPHHTERLRLSDVFLWSTAVGMALFFLLFLHASRVEQNNAALLKERILLTEQLGLSDLCLFTDARYTRNPATADLASPFQEHPMSLEHFPSGSIIAPNVKRMRK
jgi:hypothetical protein